MISEETRTEKLIEAAKFLMDDIYTCICGLKILVFLPLICFITKIVFPNVFRSEIRKNSIIKH